MIDFGLSSQSKNEVGDSPIFREIYEYLISTDMAWFVDISRKESLDIVVNLLLIEIQFTIAPVRR